MHLGTQTPGRTFVEFYLPYQTPVHLNSRSTWSWPSTASHTVPTSLSRQAGYAWIRHCAESARTSNFHQPGRRFIYPLRSHSTQLCKTIYRRGYRSLRRLESFNSSQTNLVSSWDFVRHAESHSTSVRLGTVDTARTLCKIHTARNSITTQNIV